MLFTWGGGGIWEDMYYARDDEPRPVWIFFITVGVCVYYLQCVFITAVPKLFVSGIVVCCFVPYYKAVRVEDMSPECATRLGKRGLEVEKKLGSI
jgi:hypothetical protein